jgi:ABC-2 type transport system ATP-binding protein
MVGEKSMASVIDTYELSKSYGQRVGIDGVNLHVAEGEIFGFLGPNGAGKTTTIRLLLGLVRPTRGAARVLGRDAWRQADKVKRDVGYLPGDLRLYSWMTAATALHVFGRIRGTRGTKTGEELAARFGLELNLRVRKMSRGMRQKLGLILAMAHQPRLLILDEPTSGLDPLMQDELSRYLRFLAQRGHTIFFSSHTLREVEQLCDRVAIVRGGRVVADEPLDELRRRARRIVRLFFADAEAAQATAPPSFLSLVARDSSQWECELVGPADELLRWAGPQQAIRDVEIGQPDLETVFRSYYRLPETPA